MKSETIYVIILIIIIFIPFILSAWNSYKNTHWIEKTLSFFAKPFAFAIYAGAPFLLFIFGFRNIITSNDYYILSSFSLILIAIFSYLRFIISSKDSLLKVKKDIDTSILGFEKTQEKIDKSLKTIKEIHSNLNTHPIIASKDSFRIIIDKLLELKSTKELAMHFALESLEQISTKAFVKIDISLIEYTQKLLEFIERTNNSIIGTYTFRPKYLYDELKTHTNTELKTSYIKGIRNKE